VKPDVRAHGGEGSGSNRLLMEQAVARENAEVALRRVRRNKAGPGIDGVTVDELEPYLRENWRMIRQQLLAGTYQPSAVKRTLIEKSGEECAIGYSDRARPFHPATVPAGAAADL
jgi:hypothetical protein